MNKEIESKISLTEAEVSNLVIASQSNLALANEHRRGIKELIKEVEATFTPIKKKTHEAWKEAVAQEKKYLEPLQIAAKSLQSKMGQYMFKVEQERRAEEERLANEVRIEREKAIAKASKKVSDLLEKCGDLNTQIDALQAQLEQTADDAELKIIRTKLDVLIAKKVAAEERASAQVAAVEQIQASPVITPVIEKPKVAGMSFRTEKRGEVVNKIEIIRAVADSQLPYALLDVNMTVLNKLLNAGITIGGVRVIPKPITSTRAA